MSAFHYATDFKCDLCGKIGTVQGPVMTQFETYPAKMPYPTGWRQLTVPVRSPVTHSSLALSDFCDECLQLPFARLFMSIDATEEKELTAIARQQESDRAP